MKIWLTIIFGVFICVSACKNSNGFITHKSGFKYQLFSESDTASQLKEGDIIDISLKYSAENDSVLFYEGTTTGSFRLEVLDSIQNGMFHKALYLLKENDSAVFIIPAEDFFSKTRHEKIPKGIFASENLKFYIHIHHIFSDEELKAEYEEYLNIQKSKEFFLLNEYLKNENITAKPLTSGIYIIRESTGNGKTIKQNQIVTVHYTGSLINGQIFDSSIDRGKPIKFRAGVGDVIPAWDEAVLTMRKGEKIKLIAPSKTAYGSNGYEKIVPPFATLVFQIKIIDVQ
jgi:FKBP-type peptidyl-prolyl cis-trans isomerase